MDRSTPRIEPLEARIAPASIQGMEGFVIQKLGGDNQGNTTNENVPGNQLNLINVTDGDGIAYNSVLGSFTLTTEQPTRGSILEFGTLSNPIPINLSPERDLDLGFDLLRGNERLAFADMNGDRVVDTIAVNPGGAGLIRVIDGKTNELFEGVFSGLRPFLSSAGGATVAVGDIDHDGRADIVVGSDIGGKVKVFDGRDGSLMDFFRPFGADYQGGVNVAVGDINGDGVAEIIVGQSGGGTKVKVFNGPDSDLIASFKAGTGFRGVQVSVSDLDTDGVAEIVAKYGRKNAPITKYFSAEDIFQPLQVSENHQTIASINRIDVQRFQGAPSGFTLNYGANEGSDAQLFLDIPGLDLPVNDGEMPYDETADVTGGSFSLGSTTMGAGTLTIAGSDTYYPGQTINSGGSFLLGSVSMGGAITKTGSSTLTLTGSASHSLAHTIQNNSGGLTLSDNPFLSSGFVNLDGGTLTFDAGSFNLGQSEGTISPTGTLGSSVETMGTLTLTANSSIVFGEGDANRLIFEDLTANGFKLAIYGWSGHVYTPSETIDHGPASGVDRISLLSPPE